MNNYKIERYMIPAAPKPEANKVLIITDKPVYARAIAEALANAKTDASKGETFEERNGYLESEKTLIAWCNGHLVGLAPPDSYKEAWGRWSLDVLPMIPDRWKLEVKVGARKQFQLLKKLMDLPEVGLIYAATDADREGELTFRLLYEMAGCTKPVRRVWTSSMEGKAIRKAMKEAAPIEAYDQLYQAALCRLKVDWLLGINMTRLYTCFNHGKPTKIGRVQTPTLFKIVQGYSMYEISPAYDQYCAHLKILPDLLDTASEGFIFESYAEKLVEKCCKSTHGVWISSIKQEKVTIPLPELYNLTDLQIDAGNEFGFTGKQTLEYAQSLYEKKLITYPKTDSRKAPEEMDGYGHHAIMPTGEAERLFPDDLPENVKSLADALTKTKKNLTKAKPILADDLPDTEKKLLSLIRKRVEEHHGQPESYESITIKLFNGVHHFDASLRKDECGDEQWRYLTSLKEGQEIVNNDIVYSVEKKRIPAHLPYTEGQLLGLMENLNAEFENFVTKSERECLGTPSTRAEIIEKLITEKYVERKDGYLIPTEAGKNLAGQVASDLINTTLTSDCEEAYQKIEEGTLSSERFLSDMADRIRQIIEYQIAANLKEQDRIGGKIKVLGKCPNCGADVRTGRYNAYCSAKCGMQVAKLCGIRLSNMQVKDVLENGKVFLRNLKTPKGSNFNCMVIVDGVAPYSYESKGIEKCGFEYRFRFDFSNGKSSSRNTKERRMQYGQEDPQA